MTVKRRTAFSETIHLCLCAFWALNGGNNNDHGTRRAHLCCPWRLPDTAPPRAPCFTLQISPAPRRRHPRNGASPLSRTSSATGTSCFECGSDAATAPTEVGQFSVLFLHLFVSIGITVCASVTDSWPGTGARRPLVEARHLVQKMSS